MDKTLKFLGICIVIASLIISVAMYMSKQVDRYYLDAGRVFDKQTGELYFRESNYFAVVSDSTFWKIDYKNSIMESLGAAD